jgi:competence protein ComEC
MCSLPGHSTDSSPALARLEELAHERKIPIEHEFSGKSFRWDGVDGIFLWPEIGPEEVASSAKNNDSLVLRLHYGGRTFLLPGDAEKQVEREILSANTAEAIHSDVLKIGHHGSKNSTTPEFLATVQPRFGIISAGEDNPYGHPSPELLERLENAGVRVLRTDRDGDVHVLTDGTRLEISCFIACAGAANAVSAQAEAPNYNQDQEKK